MEKKKSKKFWLIILGILIIAELAMGIISLSEYDMMFNIVMLLPMVFVALYGFWFYKKPHGNMLKYTMLLSAIVDFLITIACIKCGWDTYYIQTILLFAYAVLVYAAGRLNRIEQNKYLLPIASVVQLVCMLVEVILFNEYTFIYRLSWFAGPIATFALMIAYFVRFKEHKEAGLMDTPKK